MGLALPAWAGLAVMVWTWMMEEGVPPLDMRSEVWRVLRIAWIALASTAATGIVAGYLRRTMATPEESLLYLQDELWRQTRREQSSLNRWLTWARCAPSGNGRDRNVLVARVFRLAADRPVDAGIRPRLRTVYGTLPSRDVGDRCYRFGRLLGRYSIAQGGDRGAHLPASAGSALSRERGQGDKVIGRLAPSPTGAQHVGNARTYLIAWLSARSRGSRVVLRIENIDSPRVKAGADQQACRDLQWLGLDWDEGPIVQTERLEKYLAALVRLQQQELVYPCTCTRGDVESAASAPHWEHEGPVYPGTCAGRCVLDVGKLTNRPYCWRFRVPPVSPSFVDGFRGPTHLDLRAIGGDFVVWKAPRPGGAESTPAYQLAVVVDDAGQGVTEVVRGDDLIPSTPRQLLLYQALGLTPPQFVHVPLVVGPDGRRLAKRHGDTRLSALREAGARPEMLLGLLAWSCRWIPAIAPIRAHDLIPLFRLETVPREPFVLTPKMLGHISYHYAPADTLSMMPSNEVYGYLAPRSTVSS